MELISLNTYYLPLWFMKMNLPEIFKKIPELFNSSLTKQYFPYVMATNSSLESSTPPINVDQPLHLK